MRGREREREMCKHIYLSMCQKVFRQVTYIVFYVGFYHILSSASLRIPNVRSSILTVGVVYIVPPYLTFAWHMFAGQNHSKNIMNLLLYKWMFIIRIICSRWPKVIQFMLRVNLASLEPKWFLVDFCPSEPYPTWWHVSLKGIQWDTSGQSQSLVNIMICKWAVTNPTKYINMKVNDFVNNPQVAVFFFLGLTTSFCLARFMSK